MGQMAEDISAQVRKRLTLERPSVLTACPLKDTVQALPFRRGTTQIAGLHPGHESLSFCFVQSNIEITVML